MTRNDSEIEKHEEQSQREYAMATVQESSELSELGEHKHNTTVATTVSVNDSPSLVGGQSVYSVDPSILQQLSTIAEPLATDRQAILFCGCCCDLRRACIIVNVINYMYIVAVVFISLGGIQMVEGLNTDLGEIDYVDDDALNDRYSELGTYEGLYFIFIVIELVGLLFTTLGIVGAVKFNRCLVLTCAIWYCFETIFAMCVTVWWGAVIKGFFAYPHIALLAALTTGKISRRRYTIERYCCCDSNSDV